MKIWRVAAMVLLFGAANALGGNYDGMLEDGMSYRQVVQMLDGDPGEKINEYMFAGQKMEIYRWGTLVKGFIGGRLQNNSASLTGMSALGLSTFEREKRSPLDKFVGNPSDNKDITPEKFEAVEIDMTPETVFKILGKTNINVKTYTDETTAKHKEISFYQWFNEYSPGSMNVIFLDNEVVAKGEAGLHPVVLSCSDHASLKIGMNSEKVMKILGRNLMCRKYMQKVGIGKPENLNLCRWWIENGKMNVVFLNDMVIGTWNYLK